MIITRVLNNDMKYRNNERGIALLITLLVMTVLLGVSASLLNITIKQLQFSSIGLASEMAFQASNAGMECMLYHDYQGYPLSKFDVGQARPSIGCMGAADSNTIADTNTASKAIRTYKFDWGSPAVCSEMTIYKFYNPGATEDMSTALGRSGDCAQGVTCTVIRARGYNVACGSIYTPRTIERELTQRY